MENKKDVIALIIAVTVVIVSVVTGITWYNVNDRNHMANNIETAIGRGMDAMSVRCAYASSMDTICVAYAASNKR
jgi:steroid 5-alpha reductase family enzyme